MTQQSFDTALVDVCGIFMGLVGLAILGWMALEQLYIDQRWFRRAWEKTGLPFPHTTLSPYHSRNRRDVLPRP